MVDSWMRMMIKSIRNVPVKKVITESPKSIKIPPKINMKNPRETSAAENKINCTRFLVRSIMNPERHIESKAIEITVGYNTYGLMAPV